MFSFDKANRLIFYFLFLIVFVSSCSQKKESAKLKHLLKEDKMVEVMVDVHIFETMVENSKMSKDSLSLYAKRNYLYLFKKHDITEQEFNQTFNFYENNPEKMDDLYLKIVDELSKKEAAMKADKNKADD